MPKGRKRTYTGGARRTSICFHQPDYEYIEEFVKSHEKLKPTRFISKILAHAVKELKAGTMGVSKNARGEYIITSSAPEPSSLLSDL